MTRRALLCGAIVALVWSVHPCEAGGARSDDWTIRDGRLYADGHWVFLKIGKPLRNFADRAACQAVAGSLGTLQAKGFNALELNCYWHHFDRDGDGTIDVSLEPLAELVDAIHRRGMFPCLSVETYGVGGGTIPEPFWQRHPEAIAINAEGQPARDLEYGFKTAVPSILHAGYRQAVRSYIRGLVSGLPHRKILFYETTVEPQFMGHQDLDYSPSAKRAFQAWSARQDRPVPAWPDQFPVPAAFRSHPDWLRFRAESLADWVNGDAAAFRAAAGDDAYVAVDYLETCDATMPRRNGDSVRFLECLTGADIIQLNWHWRTDAVGPNECGYRNVHDVRRRLGRSWAISEHMTLNGSDYVPAQVPAMLRNTLANGTGFGWEFVNVAAATRDPFALYDDDWSPKPLMAEVDDHWPEWQREIASARRPAAEVHVSPAGDDRNPGTADRPLATFAAAQRAARTTPNTIVLFHAGVYSLPETVVLTAADSGTVFAAARDEEVVVSGGTKLALQWRAAKDGVLEAETPAGLVIDQLFVDGRRQRMARYPNYDPEVRPYGGYAADAFSRERSARWADPMGGFIHAMHRAHWGGYHYRITGRNAQGEIVYEGGWQNNRPMGMHDQHRYVENIREELDAPGEWFHDGRGNTLSFMPPAGTDMKPASVEVVRLRQLIECDGARDVTLRGFIFRHAARTFMDVREPLLRSDWTFHRGGALLLTRTERCTVEDCEFDQVGGNAIVVSGSNRGARIVGCHMHDVGGSGVAFVGDPGSVRNPLFNYGQRQRYAEIDRTPGPKTADYPVDCIVDDCLIRGVGVVEKQAAGVQISMARRITVRHCSIYDTSRAGINVSEGTFGGHVIEFCDVFDTVRETGDHGSFNSWGRDRFWGLEGAPADELPHLALLDAVETTVIRNSRWRCDHGWDVDLDDGSSNYEIHDNLFLHGGLKLREGFHRRVWNNIAVDNSLHPHVWYENCGDEVTRNIWMGSYRPALMREGTWGREIDRNLFTTTDTDRTKFAAHGCDPHSLVGDPLFMDPAAGDYRVKEGSPALRLGFRNFPMDRFGVRHPRLKAIARTPELPGARPAAGRPAAGENHVPLARHWQGAEVRDLSGEEYSAFGVSRESGGVRVLGGAIGDIRVGDLIQSIDGQPVRNVAELWRRQDATAGKPLTIGFVRDQKPLVARQAAYTFVSVDAKAPGGPRGGAPIQGIRARPATSNEPVASLADGRLAETYGPVFPNGVVGGTYKVDLGRPVSVATVTTWSSNHNGVRGPQRFALFGSDATHDPGWDPAAFEPIAEVDTTDRHAGPMSATVVRRTADEPLGSFRWLLWVTQPVTDRGENTAFQEFEVTAAQ